MLASRWFLAQALVAGGAYVAQCQDRDSDSANAAATALRSGNAAQAVEIATRVLGQAPTPDREALWIRANAYESLEQYTEATRDYRRLADLDPSQTRLLLDLGGAAFKAADMGTSIEAFDRAAQLDQSVEPHLWQRGIAHYYAERFADCIRQFETHRTVNPRDVENSAWHFLSVAASKGFDEARTALIPVEGDTRVPMMEVFALFEGKSSVEDVLRAADRASSAGRGSAPSFYAHLYLGLFYEARGDAALAAEHVSKAVEFRQPRNYMWQVARVHQALRSRSGPAP